MYKSIAYYLNKRYKKYNVKPFIIVYGLRTITSYARNIPCLDVNIFCVAKDKYGNDLFNTSTLIEDIYKGISTQAKETIKIQYHEETPNNTLDNNKQLPLYLESQVDIKLLRHFQKSEYASLLPNTWLYIPPSLKKYIREHNYKDKHPKTEIKDHRKALQKLGNKVIIKDKEGNKHKLVAQIKNPTPERIKNIRDDYDEKLYSKLSNEKQCNNLSKGDVEKTPQDLFGSKVNQLNYSKDHPIGGKIKFYLENFPPEWNIKSLTDVAVLLNADLAREVEKYNGLASIDDLALRGKIIRAMHELFFRII